jgi:hypothetical protein
MVATLAERADDPGQAAALGKTINVAGATPVVVVVGQGDLVHQCGQVIFPISSKAAQSIRGPHLPIGRKNSHPRAKKPESQPSSGMKTFTTID